MSILPLALSALVSFFCLHPIEQTSKSTICTQEEFDEMIRRINKGDTISERLLPGVYNLPISVTANAPVTITGEDAVVLSYTDSYDKHEAVRETATHYVCKLKTPLNEFSLMVSQTGEHVEVSESVNDTTLVNLASSIGYDNDIRAGMEVRIPIPENLTHLKNKTFGKAFGYFDCGWTNIKFKLKSSDCQNFFCETLHTTNVPRLDYEKSVYKDDIRFVIYNAEVKPKSVYYDEKYVYIPKEITSLYVKNCDVFTDSSPEITINGDIYMKGVKFEGIDEIRINSAPYSRCVIDSCSFRNTIGNTLTVSKKNGQDFIPACINGCKFESCSLLRGNILDLHGYCDNKADFFIKGCEFVRYPDDKVRYKNTSGMVNVNADTRISDCILWNTSRCHLYFTTGDSKSIGNVIYNTSGFNFVKDRNLSNDWGLIYVNHVYTDSEKAKLNNLHKVLIHGCILSGAHAHANDARGVMIDNGRGDVRCIDNIVLDCQSYSLDSRDAKNFVSVSSIRNVFEGNILDNRYRLQGGMDVERKDRPISKGNILLGEYNNVFNSCIENTNTVISAEMYLEDNKIYMDNAIYSELKNRPLYRKFEKYFRKRPFLPSMTAPK